MCGIVGIVEHRNGPFPRDALARMNGLLAHRGPDDEGTWIEGGVGLAQRRLSIIDLETGHQPLSNEDGSLWVVYNGEVYNYLELRKALERRGHRFRTRSDTEVIVHLYEEKGPECLHDLRGMFAIAVWNRRDRSLFLARDRLGIKPMFYAATPGAFLFASEIKSLLAHPDVDRGVDRAALVDYLTYRYVSAPGTLFKNVRKLRPGHYLTLRDGEVRETRYWDVFGQDDGPDPAIRAGGRAACARRLRELLQESVGLRLRSDVPLGAFLSGGVDSTALVGIMTGLMARPVETFSVGFEDPEFNELPYAREVSRRFGTIHREVLVNPRDIPAHLPSLIWHRDAPVSEPSDVALYLVSRLARESVKVVLSGEGGDELFAGYTKYVLDPFAGLYQRLPARLEGPLIACPVESIPFVPRRVKAAVRSLRIRDEAERFASYFASLDLSEREQVLSRDFLASVQAERLPDGSGPGAPPGGWAMRTPQERMFYTDLKNWLPDNLLERGDRITMAASLEGRVPLLDHKLVEFAARIPAHWKRKGLRTKVILKEAVEDLLPASVLRRRKVGFTVPVRAWFRNELRDWATDILCSEATRNRGIFRHDQVRSILDRHVSGQGDFSKQIWMLINLELWFRGAAATGEVAPKEGR